jgi:hypothetical protein
VSYGRPAKSGRIVLVDKVKSRAQPFCLPTEWALAGKLMPYRAKRLSISFERFLGKMNHGFAINAIRDDSRTH